MNTPTTPRRRRRGRPATGRHHRVTVRFSDTEYELVHALARCYGQTDAAYLRDLSQNRLPDVAPILPRDAQRHLWCEVAALGRHSCELAETARELVVDPLAATAGGVADLLVAVEGLADAVLELSRRLDRLCRSDAGGVTP